MAKGNASVRRMEEAEIKSRFAKDVLEKLPEWFGDKEALDAYVREVAGLPFWAALSDGKCLGFFAVSTHYAHTGEIVVCGVLPEAQHAGIGKALYYEAESYFRETGCKYAVVKTLSDRVDFQPYAQTRRFYRSVGFEPLMTLTEMWDSENPCLIMLKTLV